MTSNLKIMNNENIYETKETVQVNKKKDGYKVLAMFSCGFALVLCAVGWIASDITVEVLKTTGQEMESLEARAKAAEARVAELEKPKTFTEKLKGLVQN